ncbi:pilin [Acidovorax cavernicola]|nr:pilin [Acidovorax cavernicola]
MGELAVRIEPTLGSSSDWQALAPSSTTGNAAVDQASLYAAAIGPHNQGHYVAKFKAFDRTSSPHLGWHWPAFFLTVYWLLYRKLWWHALGYFAAPYVLLAMAAMLVPMVGADWAAMVGLGFFALLFVVPALLGDGIYYRRCRQLIEQARAESSDARTQLAYLSKEGGTSKVVAVLFYVLFVPALIGMLAAIALPAYQDYTVRARLHEALVQAKAASSAVESFYARNRRIPGDFAEADFSASPTPHVREMRVDTRSGIITVVMNTSVVAGRSLLLIPKATADGVVTWTCRSEDIPVHLLPRECR